MSIAELLFELPSIDGWETRLQVTYIAPLEPADPNFPAQIDREPAPRSNVVVSRVTTSESDATGACSTFLSQTASAVPDFDVVTAPVDVTFEDGVQGVVVEVAFFATARVRLRQFHAFRIDGTILTQLVATADEAGDPQKRDELRQKLLGFAPNAGLLTTANP
jgi:hypothetical protein